MQSWRSVRAALRVGIVAAAIASSACASTRGGRGAAHEHEQRELGEAVEFHDTPLVVGFRRREVATTTTSMDVTTRPHRKAATTVHIDRSKHFVAQHEVIDLHGSLVDRVEVEEAFTLATRGGESTREESVLSGRTYLIGDGPKGLVIVHDDLSAIDEEEHKALVAAMPWIETPEAPKRDTSKRAPARSARPTREAKLSDAPVRIGERSAIYESKVIAGLGVVDDLEDIDTYLDRKGTVRGEPCAIFAQDVTYTTHAEGMSIHLRMHGEESIRLVDSSVAETHLDSEMELERPEDDENQTAISARGTVRLVKTNDFR